MLENSMGWGETCHIRRTTSSILLPCKWAHEREREEERSFFESLVEILICSFLPQLGVCRSPKYQWIIAECSQSRNNNLRGFIGLMIQSIREEIWKDETKCSSHTCINESALLRQCFSHATGLSLCLAQTHTLWLSHLQLIGFLVCFHLRHRCSK